MLVLIFTAQPVQSADWQWSYTLGNTVQYSDNIQLHVNPKGPAGSSQTNGGFDLKALSRSWQWALGADFGYLVYFGEGAPTRRSSKNVAADSSISKSTRDTDYSLSAHFSEAPAQSTQQTELGIVTSNILQLSYGAVAQIVHRSDRLDTFNVNVRADRSDFSQTGSGPQSSTTLEGTSTWTRQLTPLVDGRLLTSVQYYRLEGSPQTEQLIYNIALGGKARLSKRLTVDANIGPTIVQQLGSGTTTSIDVSGDLTINYQPRKDLNVSLSLSEDISPDNLGGLRQFQSAIAALGYQINDYASFNLAASYSNSTGTGNSPNSSRYLTVSPSFTYILARDLNAVLSYRWARSDAGSGIAQSHSVFLTLSYNGILLH